MRELSLHILDLVQNSIEAGAGKVTLELIEERHGMDTFLIRVTDNGSGMSMETCKRVMDPFVTTRTTRHIGLGLPLLEMTTKRCNGSLTVTSRVGIGTVVEAVYQHSHLDRPPLGNLVDTIKSIIIANQEMDFSYFHQVDQATFSLGTGEMREILGDISFTQPDVLVWLHEYLTDHVMKLYQ